MDKIEEFNGIKLLSGINTHPGSGNARQHQEEYDKFQHVLLKNNFTIMEECEFGSVGGDGMFFAAQKKQ